MAKRYVTSGAPPAWETPAADDDAKRAASRERNARTRRPAKVSRNPQIADSKRDRWRSRERALKAAAEGREVNRYE